MKKVKAPLHLKFGSVAKSISKFFKSTLFKNKYITSYILKSTLLIRKKIVTRWMRSCDLELYSLLIALTTSPLICTSFVIENHCTRYHLGLFLVHWYLVWNRDILLKTMSAALQLINDPANNHTTFAYFVELASKYYFFCNWRLSPQP